MKNNHETHEDGVILSEEDYVRIIAALRKMPQYENLPEEMMRSRIDELLSGAKYADPMNDLIFASVFGKRKENLLLLLQAILPDLDISEVVEVSNRVIADTPEDKAGVYDIVCKTEDGVYINIEAQKNNRIGNRERWAYYLADLMRRQFVDGLKDYKKMRPSYCIIIQSESERWDIPSPDEVVRMMKSQEEHPFEMRLDKMKLVNKNDTPFEHQVLMHFKMVDMFSLMPYGDQFNIMIINLDQMDKGPSQLASKLDKLLFILKNLPNIVEIPTAVMKEYSRILDNLAIRKMGKSDFDKYVINMYTEKDTKEISEYAAKAAREDTEYKKNKEIEQIKREKDAVIEQKDAEIEQKDAEIEQIKREKDAVIEQKDAEIEQKDAEIEQKDAEIEQIKRENNAKIKNLEEQLLKFRSISRDNQS